MQACNVRVVSVPFGINGLEYYGEAIDKSNPGVLIRPTIQSSAVAGTARGVLQLFQQIKVAPPLPEKSLYVASLHQKGRLLVWDAETLEVTGVCYHRGCSVVQCIMTETYIYARVESGPQQEPDEEWKVYVWYTKTLDLYRQLSSHQGRVTNIVVNELDDAQFATSSVDHSINIWDLNKNTMEPIRKIMSTGSASVLLYLCGAILGGCADAPFMAWDVDTGEEVFRSRPKESDATVTAVRWLHESKKSGKTSVTRQRQHASIFTGDCDGILREWNVDLSGKGPKVSMTLKWARKVHRAHINDICGDNNVVLTFSSLDGAFLCMSTSGKIVPLVSYGVRTGVLDTISENVILGVDNGSVEIFSYADLIKGFGEVVPIASFTPQTSSVTGLLLQLRADHTWDRIICSGADGSVTFLDYSKSRHGRAITGMVRQSVDYISQCGAIVYPVTTNNGIMTLNTHDLLPFDDQPDVPHTVTALRWSESAQVLAVGSEKGNVILYKGIFDDCRRNPKFEMMSERNYTPFFVRNFSLSEPDGSLLVANMQRNLIQIDGAFLVIDLKEGDLSNSTHMTSNVYPIRSSIFTFKGSDVYNYVAIFQLRDGALVQYAGQTSSRTPPVRLRMLSGSLLADIANFEVSGISIYPSSFVIFTAPTGSGVMDLILIYADGSSLKKITFSALSGGEVERQQFGSRPIPGTPNAGDSVVQLLPLTVGEQAIAVLQESPHVDITSASGEYLFRISYSGDVLSYHAMGYTRRSRSYPSDTVSLESSMQQTSHGSPHACTAAFCAEMRYLAIGYRDGVVQLFDTTQKIVFIRLAHHTSMVTSLWAFPEAILSATADGSCHVDHILRRVMFDVKDGSTASISASSAAFPLRRTSASISSMMQAT